MIAVKLLGLAADTFLLAAFVCIAEVVCVIVTGHWFGLTLL